MFAREAAGCAARRKRRISHSSMPNALTMPLPVMVSCRMFWISASLSCPVRVVCRTRRPMRRADEMTTGTNSSSTQASLPPYKMTTPAMKMNVKNCCRKSPSTVDIAVCTRSTSLISVDSSVPVVCFWKNAVDRRSTAFIQIVAQIRDHAEAGVVHQVGARRNRTATSPAPRRPAHTPPRSSALWKWLGTRNCRSSSRWICGT